jgi:hypothetical protein
VYTGVRVLDNKKEIETIKEQFRTLYRVQFVPPKELSTPLTANQAELMRAPPARQRAPAAPLSPMASNSAHSTAIRAVPAAASTTHATSAPDTPSAFLLEAEVREFLLARFGSGVLRDVTRAALHFITQVLVSTVG